MERLACGHTIRGRGGSQRCNDLRDLCVFLLLDLCLHRSRFFWVEVPYVVERKVGQSHGSAIYALRGSSGEELRESNFRIFNWKADVIFDFQIFEICLGNTVWLSLCPFIESFGLARFWIHCEDVCAEPECLCQAQTLYCHGRSYFALRWLDTLFAPASDLDQCMRPFRSFSFFLTAMWHVLLSAFL